MLKQTLLSLKSRVGAVRRYPKKYTIGGAIGILLLALLVTGLWPRTIELSYSGASCISQRVILPSALTNTKSDDFTLHAGDDIVSDKLCVKTNTPPAPGDHHVILSVFGLPIGKQMTISVGALPTLANTALTKPIPVTKPMRLNLSAEDTLFNYRLEMDKKSVACTTIAGSTVMCNVERLDLKQGVEYAASFYRYYGDKKVEVVAREKVKTLSAVAVTDTSIRSGEMIYANPKSVQVKFDKPVVSATATIEKINSPDSKPVPVEVIRSDEGLSVQWEQDLDRLAEYQLTLDKVVATDESSLIEPYKLPFKLSGGPKVASINVPKIGVNIGTTAIITFDQPLSEKQDIAKSIALTGGATFVSKRANQISLSLAAVPKCGDFSIKLSNDLQSNYDIGGQSGWSFTGRMVCHTVGSIGSSAKGRSITAYYFGSGPSTVIYTGAIHGNEVSTRSLMLRWVDELDANARSIPANKSIVVIPTLNPDGVASGSRTNGNNVDLNRNFGTGDWRTDITTVSNAPFPGGGGKTPMSEPETKAIASLVSRLRPSLVLSYHSIGGIVAANQVGLSNGYANTYAGLSGYRNATGSTTTFEYAVSGTADDYYGEKLGVSSVLIELGSHSYHQFERNQKAMWAMMR